MDPGEVQSVDRVLGTHRGLMRVTPDVIDAESRELSIWASPGPYEDLILAGAHRLRLSLSFDSASRGSLGLAVWHALGAGGSAGCCCEPAASGRIQGGESRISWRNVRWFAMFVRNTDLRMKGARCTRDTSLVE